MWLATTRRAATRMIPARRTFTSAINGPRSKRSANAPAGSATSSQGRLSAAATAETASGCGFTTTARSGTAPYANPSPELARVKPTHSRAKGRPSLRRCRPRLRILIESSALHPHRECRPPLLTAARIIALSPTRQAAGAASARSKNPLKAATRRVDKQIATLRPRGGTVRKTCYCPGVAVEDRHWFNPNGCYESSLPTSFTRRYRWGTRGLQHRATGALRSPRPKSLRCSCNLIATNSWAVIDL